MTDPAGSENNRRMTEQRLRLFVDAYINFPTAENFDLVAARMREYQTAWMHKRGKGVSP